MPINILNSIEQASEATGLIVVIDVFRAFSTECFVFQNGAEKIIPVAGLNQAYELKQQNPSFILMGERAGLPPAGFDFGNSPTEIENIDFTGKTVIHTSSNGTRGIELATKADCIITGAFVNAGAIINFIQKNNFDEVSLLSTSEQINEENEDLIFAKYIQNKLLGLDPSLDEISRQIRKSSTANFLINERGVPARDIDLCLNFSRFNFVLKVEKEAGFNVIKQFN